MKKVYPVIHHIDNSLTQDQADLAFDCGADGVFVISHYGNNQAAISSTKLIHLSCPDEGVGVNPLSEFINKVEDL